MKIQLYISLSLIVFSFSIGSSFGQYYVYDTESQNGFHCGAATGDLQAVTGGAQIVRWEEGYLGAEGVFNITATHNVQSPTFQYSLPAGTSKAFRVVLSTGGLPFPSQSFTITTSIPPIEDILSAETSTYLNSASGAITYTGGSGTLVWQVFHPTDGWTDTTLPNGQYNLTTTTTFRTVRSSWPCGEEISNSVKIEVYKAGTIAGPPSTVEGTRITLGLSDFYKDPVRWEVSTDGGESWRHIIHPYGEYRHEVVANSKFRVLVDLGPYGTAYSDTHDVTYTPYSQAYSDPVNGLNYTREQVLTRKGVRDQYAVSNLGPEYKQELITYADGVGRTVQQNFHKASPLQKDIVSISDYDALGRLPNQYLPFVSNTDNGFFKVNPFNELYPFYLNGAADKIADNSHPYATTVFESSPLGRVTEQGMPGRPWHPEGDGHTQKLRYSNNTILDEVRLFRSDGSSTGFYPPNALSILENEDEDGKTTQVFTNKEGRPILSRVQLDEMVDGNLVSWLETYYVYNEGNAVRYIVSPKGVATLKSNGWTMSDEVKEQYVHEFVYDSRGRVVEKKIPGQGWLYYCYDRFDRLVIMQDGNMRTGNSWVFFKYDKMGRVVRQGVYTNNVNTTRTSIQDVIDQMYQSESDVYFEDNSGTNYCFPTDNLVDHVINTYDNYSVSYTPQGLQDEATPWNPSGLLTSSSRLILGTSTWLTTHVIYDIDGRVIQEIRNNHLSPSIDNLKTYIYDFQGKVKLTKVYHNAGSGRSTTVINKYVYDHAGRIKQVYQRNNGDAEVLVVHYNYNELGQLVEKNLHCTTCTSVDPLVGTEGSSYNNTIQRDVYNKDERVLIASEQISLLPGFKVSNGDSFRAKIGKSLPDVEATYNSSQFLQSVDFRYDVRGKLSSINNSRLDLNALNNDDENDYFGMEFLYNNVEAGLTTTSDALYNGNISAVKWKTSTGGELGSAGQNSYKYTYDNANRLRTAISQSFDELAWTKEAGALNESTSYDLNGNIQSLQRNSRKHNLTIVENLPVITYTHKLIDDLDYTYNSVIGDQLVRVTDGSGNSEGFDNGSSGSTANDYTYDLNGNLLRDKNKGIDTDIVYNHLGKPTTIAFADGRRLEYLYDALGSKLSMKVYGSAGSVLATTDYVDGFVYENNGLSFFASPEGRVVKNGNLLEYQYAIGDHQGNTRIVFSSVTPDPKVYLATFEDPIEDTNEFFGVPTSSPHWTTFYSANNTPGGDKVIRLNQNLSVGPAKSLKVYPGDKIDMEVWAHFQNPSGFGTSSPSLPVLVGNIAGAFGGLNGGAGEAGAIYTGVDDALASFGTGGNQGDDAPGAYLNYILFDASYNVLNMGWRVVPSSALNTKQKISIPTVDVTHHGYIFVYLSYEDESNNYVEFDDFQVTHTKTNIIQYNEYYPFGLQASTSWTREDSKNDFLYNAGSELNVTSGWYETFYRNYDAAIGRFVAIDPLSTKFASLSGYHFSYNNPVLFNDPLGAEGTAYGDYSGPGSDPYQNYNGPQGYWNSNGDWLWYDPTGDAGAYAGMGMHHLYQDRVATAQMLGRARSGSGGVSQNRYGEWGYWVESGYQDWEGAGRQATFVRCDECGVGVPPVAPGTRSWNGTTLASAGAIALTTSAVDGPFPFGEMVGAGVVAGAAVYNVYENRELIAKQAREVANLLKKAAGPQGFTYMLTVNVPGTYLDVRGIPVTLNTGDVWKFGETTRDNRYTQGQLNTMVPGGVTMIPIYFGNQVEIKVAEKTAIYGYFFQNGSLPPGNRIFR